jgi:hypothetical protein
VTSETDVYRTAKVLIDRPGKEAAVHTAMRADELLAKSDLDAQRTYCALALVAAALGDPSD